MQCIICYGMMKIRDNLWVCEKCGHDEPTELPKGDAILGSSTFEKAKEKKIQDAPATIPKKSKKKSK